MAGNWGVGFDIAEALQGFEALGGGLARTEELHEIFIIELQVMTFRNWPTQPALSRFTLGARARGGSAVLQDSGMMRQSFTGKAPSTQISRERDSLHKATRKQAVFGSKDFRAGPHHRGDTIRPRKAKNLALPATPEATKSKGPRSFSRKLFWIPVVRSGGRSTGWLAEREGEGKSAKIKRQFLLMREVKLPQRKLIPTLEEARPRLSKAAELWIQAKRKASGL